MRQTRSAAGIFTTGSMVSDATSICARTFPDKMVLLARGIQEVGIRAKSVRGPGKGSWKSREHQVQPLPAVAYGFMGPA